MAYMKPLPPLEVWSRPFWDACREQRLIAQRCDVSGEVFFPPAPVSPVTRTEQWSWVELSGLGTVWSWVIMHQRYFKGFAEDVPYIWLGRSLWVLAADPFVNGVYAAENGSLQTVGAKPWISDLWIGR